MYPNSKQFRNNLATQNKQKKLGKLIIISGISGSGKNVVADILVDKENCVFIDKYVTRPFRANEMIEMTDGKSIGIKAVKEIGRAHV